MASGALDSVGPAQFFKGFVAAILAPELFDHLDDRVLVVPIDDDAGVAADLLQQRLDDAGLRAEFARDERGAETGSGADLLHRRIDVALFAEERGRGDQNAVLGFGTALCLGAALDDSGGLAHGFAEESN